MNIVICAGGTGGHIFPALSVALEFKRQCHNLSLLWIGTARNREKELADSHAIPIIMLGVQGVTRTLRLSNLFSFYAFIKAVAYMHGFFKQNRPDAVVAFGGYVCAPVLAAARLNRIPYFLQEQNSVPGMVNRFFARKAQRSFVGFPLNGKHMLKGRIMQTGTPVRTVTSTFEDFEYPQGFDKTKETILISGGSQGAASMNECLIEPIRTMLKKGLQVFWQTGTASYQKVSDACKEYRNAYVVASVDDLYPFYAVAKLVICRSGASTLNEISYFGLPCILIPLPWATENHQWMNAAYVEAQGWGVRIAQDDQCSGNVLEAVEGMLSDSAQYEVMCRKALDNSSANAAAVIVREIIRELQ